MSTQSTTTMQTTFAPSIRDRALAAWQEKQQAEAAERERARQAQIEYKKRELKSVLMERLNIDVEDIPDPDRHGDVEVAIDGVHFAVRYYQPGRASLLAGLVCEECGKQVSAVVSDWAELGKFLTSNDGPLHFSECSQFEMPDLYGEQEPF